MMAYRSVDPDHFENKCKMYEKKIERLQAELDAIKNGDVVVVPRTDLEAIH